MIRRTTFCERPARGGSTTTTSGRPAPLDEFAHRESHVAGEEVRVVDAVARARWRSRRRPPPRRARRPTPRRRARPASARSCRSRRRGRSTRSQPWSRRRRRRRRRAARPSRCSSGRRPRRRSGTAGPRAPRRWPRCRQHGGDPACGASRRRRRYASTGRCPLPAASGQSVQVDAASEVTRRTCSSPVRRPSRMTRLRSSPSCARRSYASGPARGTSARTARRASLPRSDCSRQSSTCSMRSQRARRVEAADQLVRRRRSRTRTRACCGSATSRSRATIGGLLEAVELPDAAQRVARPAPP